MFKILGGGLVVFGEAFFRFLRVGEGLDGVSFSFFRDGWARDGGLSWLLFLFIFLWERERRGGGWV